MSVDQQLPKWLTVVCQALHASFPDAFPVDTGAPKVKGKTNSKRASRPPGVPSDRTTSAYQVFCAEQRTLAISNGNQPLAIKVLGHMWSEAREKNPEIVAAYNAIAIKKTDANRAKIAEMIASGDLDKDYLAKKKASGKKAKDTKKRKKDALDKPSSKKHKKAKEAEASDEEEEAVAEEDAEGEEAVSDENSEEEEVVGDEEEEEVAEEEEEAEEEEDEDEMGEE